MAPLDPAPAALFRPVKETELANGLRVLVQEIRTAPLVSVWAWYRVGSKDEAPGQTGASHWVEHMNFKGTRNIPRAEMKGLVERFGGTWNGYTWIDQTAYFETTPREALERMLFLEAERMVNGLYDLAEVEAERTVIIAELQGGDNDPEQLLDTEVTAAAFRAHPYGHPTIGWLPDLQSMTREDLYGHYRRYYIPNNAAIVIVGDVDADEVFGLVERHFGAIPPGTAPVRVRATEPPQLGERRVRIEKPGNAAYLKIAYPAPAFTDPDFCPLLVLDAVLTGAKGVNLWSSYRNPPQRRSRLYRALVDGQVAASVFGTLMPTEQPFLYTISVAVNDGVPLEVAEERTLHELDLVRTRGITSVELERARHQLRARLVFDADGVTNIAHQLGYFATIADLEHYDRLWPSIAAVTLDDVARVAGRLSAACRTVGWFQPVAAAEADVTLAAAAAGGGRAGGASA
ncbi:MAG TPA: pitrilysin family protein [Vicinamibacterales bacterium]|nr:pitrilysin family protein [Vicinamibacterales bacterium]